MNSDLEIVNAMLSAVGERKQNSLETSHPSVVKARGFLEERNRTLQARGWWFNKDYRLRLPVNTDGEVILPSNALSCSITSEQLGWSSPEAKRRYIIRGSKVYDTDRHTYVIREPITVDLVTFLSVEELPHQAYDYLKKICVADFYLDDDGDIQKHARLDNMKDLAWVALKQEEMKVLSINVNDRPAVQALQVNPGGYNFNPRYPGGLRR